MAARLARYFISKILIIAESVSVGTGSKMSGFPTYQALARCLAAARHPDMTYSLLGRRSQ